MLARGAVRVVLAMTAALMLTPAATALAEVSSEGSPPFDVETNPYTFGQAPSWAPDGKHVLFHDDFDREFDDDASDGQHVYLSRLDGSNRRCLTCGKHPAPNMVATFRPQGDKILFHAWGEHRMTVGAPGFGGMGSDLYVMNPDGSGIVNLTKDTEGHDNFHAYFSPDGRKVVWTGLNWNFVTETGRGKFSVWLADYVEDADGPRLENKRMLLPENGHFYETQWWKPDGSGFLYTESVDSATNLELFFYDITTGQSRRLTNHPAWDEQAAFTPDGQRVIFMSTRDNPSPFNEYAEAMARARVTADADYLTLLPVFAAGFLQPVFPASNDLYEIDLSDPTLAPRRLTRDGEHDWITPEFAWDPAGKRLLWTELRWRDGVRVGYPPDPAKQAEDTAGLASDPPAPDERDTHRGGQSSQLERRTRIGRFLTSGRSR
jgi:Tol biopolymer transport system component